jgi:hypothetical protein
MSDAEPIQNGRIVKTMLGHEDHGFFTCSLELEFGGAGQSFGGYGLDDRPATIGGKRRATAAGLAFIIEIIDTLEVESWERLPGAYCRVRRHQPRGLIVAIGHLLKDQWFDPQELFTRYGVGAPA